MDPSSVDGFRSFISEPRFGRYVRHCSGDETSATRLYTWNIELSAAFWGPISILEVMLRNAINTAMSAGRDPDWWNSVRLTDAEKAALKTATEKFVRKYGRQPEPDDIVGALGLGFWVALVGPGIPRDPVLSYETALWQPRLIRAFPNLGSTSRKQLHDELQRVRAFRNRIAHHEAIFNAPHEQIRDLVVDVSDSLSDKIADFIFHSHRIDDVLGRRDDAVGRGICSL